jgi:hypothetical protein
MATINTIECESIQVGLAPAPPIAGVDLWPSMDPTVPFSLQVNGINNFNALTNQIGLYNGTGLWNQLGLGNLLGFGVDVGGHVDAQPAYSSAAPSEDYSAANGNLWGGWKLNGLPVRTTSDVRFKTNITPLQNSLDKILQLRGVEYDRTDQEKHEIGMVAQEVENVIPDLVKQDSEGIKILEYENLTAVLVEAIKEQQEQINSLKQTVQELSTKLAECCS